METFTLICNLIITVCGVIPTVVTVILFVKNLIEQKNWKAIEPIVKAAMTAAEEYAKEHPGMSGEEKLDFALATIKGGLDAAGIAFDEKLVKQIVAYINELCKWSKTVNAG